ncbi:MAG: DUF2141 domain-containing protein [Bacteroidetes bacterium]|nr:MAG: DUF2141 domain-containing protein [Bacteroidota bacterium]
MKTFKGISLLIVAISFASFKQSTPDKKITVNVSNFKNTNGNCLICLFNKADGFPNKNSLKCVTAKIVGSTAQLIIEGIKPNTYAIAVVHDENKNGTLDENFLVFRKKVMGLLIITYLK